MASGRINIGSCSSYGAVNYTWYIDWTSTSNVSANTSNVTGIFYVEKVSTKNNTVWDGSVNATCTINGTVFRNSTFKWDMRSHGVGSRVEICRGTVNNIPHNADGSQSISISAYFPTDTSTAGTQSGSGTAYLDTIARASQPSLGISTIEIGDWVTIYTNRASSSFVHTVYFSFGNISWRMIQSNVGDSTKFTLPMDMLNQMTSSTSGSGTIHMETYNNGVHIGTKSVGFTATAGSNISPSIGDILVDTDTNFNNSWIFVQSKSKMRIRSACSGAYGSWITSCRVTIEGKEYWGTDIWSSTITGSSNRDINVTVWDSRGRNASKTIQRFVYAYSNPIISTATALRCNADGTINESGGYIKVNFVGSVHPVDNKNTKSFIVELWNNNTKVKDLYYSSDTYSININNVYSDIDTNKSYVVKFKTNDWYVSVTKDITIPTGFVTMDFKSNGKGIAIGKVSERNGLECKMPLFLHPSTDTLDGASDASVTFINTTNKNLTTGIYAGGSYSETRLGVYDYDTKTTLLNIDVWNTCYYKFNRNYFLSDIWFYNDREHNIRHNNSTTYAYFNSVSGNTGYYDTTHNLVWSFNEDNGVLTLRYGYVTNSDERVKYDIEDLTWDEYYDFFMSLKPKMFKYNNELRKETHIGLIAQEVGDSLVDNNLYNKKMALVKSFENDSFNDGREHSLAYQELISLNIKITQEHDKQIRSLQNKISELESKLNVIISGTL